MAPFIRGGAEDLAFNLTKNLNMAGVEAELFSIPFRWEPAEQILEQMLLCRGLKLTNVDQVIGLKFPAYLVPHDNKVMWLIHQYRQAYDLWEAGQSNIAQDARGAVLRRAIQKADDDCFQGCRSMYTVHSTTADRLKRFNGFTAEVLMPPLNDPEIFGVKESEGYIFAGGRVNAAKRQHLLVEAMRYVKSDVRLIVAGPPDSPSDSAQLEALVSEYNLGDKVRLDLRYLPRTEIASLVNHSLGVAYIPFDEDSVGYVTMEAAQASKPVITVNDAGGILDLVRERETGFVTDPDAKQLADAIDRLASSPSASRDMGLQGRESWLKRGINWETTIEKLLS
ncbi:glycosyltransferase family 4 protein [Seohaeicola saemankumensis]|uniref:Glycosyltransferase family 4 protein n=1 Tax=Seohaeicola saemankumensis TaxID=481181 RepID=A0ABW3TDV4_9RHOB